MARFDAYASADTNDTAVVIEQSEEHTRQQRRQRQQQQQQNTTAGSSSITEVEGKSVMLRPLTSEHRKVLMSRGVPGQDLIPKTTSIDVADVLVKIEQDFPYKGIPTKIISVRKQFQALQAIMDNPLKGSYCIGISSFPSDLRAKFLAQTIMWAGIEAYAKHRKPGRSLPLWHRVYGSFGDPLRDKPITDMPSMLIISNVNDQSSNIKIEKVRDLLEKFSEVPRIVISGGAAPYNLFASKLFSPMRIGFYLGPSNMVHEV